MEDLKPLSWNDLINFNYNTPLKKRPIIIVALNDKYNRKYNAIVVKYDHNFDVHVKYLDNPIGNNYWWTANNNGDHGLDPNVYNNPNFKDYVIGGYDDIINFNNESNRFFHSSDKYPFLNGIQGNVYVYKYYKELNKKINFIKKNLRYEKFFNNPIINNNNLLFKDINQDSFISFILNNLLNNNDFINILDLKNKKKLLKFYINEYNINKLIINNLDNSSYTKNNILKYINNLKNNLINDNDIKYDDLFFELISYLLNFKIIIFNDFVINNNSDSNNSENKNPVVKIFNKKFYKNYKNKNYNGYICLYKINNNYKIIRLE